MMAEECVPERSVQGLSFVDKQEKDQRDHESGPDSQAGIECNPGPLRKRVYFL